DSMPMPVEPNNGIGDGAGPIPTTPDMANTDPMAEIQALLQGLDMSDIGSLLQMISPDELSALLQQESGMNVSGDDIAQLLQQLGLTANTNTDSGSMPMMPMPVEPDNGIGDGAGPIPTTTDNSNTTGNDDIQSLLQGIDPDDISLLLQTISPDQLAEMLQQQSGLDVSAADIAQLLQQIQNINSNNDNDMHMPSMPMPVEPDNGIGDGAPDLGDLLGQTDMPPAMNDSNNPDSFNADQHINQIVQGIDPSLLSELLQMVSLEELADMLQQESGISISAEQIQQLFDQTGLSSAVDTQSAVPASSSNDSSTISSSNSSPANTDEIQDALQGIDSSQFASFFEIFSVEQLAEMLGEEGTDISADEVRMLLAQIGISA
ncbi:MAG: hypothetical protein V3U84_07185, partial [Thiotrichaceae bacterium]